MRSFSAWVRCCWPTGRTARALHRQSTRSRANPPAADVVLIDSHCHLDVGEFDADRDAVVERARACGVVLQVVPAISASGWPKLREVCASFDGLHAAYGLHPMYLDEHEDAHLEALAGWIERERPVAVGECGLDYFIDGLDRERQQCFFDGQLALAVERGLPVIVHARRAV